MNLKDLSQAVINGDEELAIKYVNEALQAGTSAVTIYREGLIPGMNVVGEKMQSGEYFIPEVLISVEVMRKAHEVLKLIMSHSEARNIAGRVIIGTVQGDLHDIGKNLVIAMLEGSGFEVIDLGVDITPDKFVNTVRDVKPDILGLSALLSVTMLNMKSVIDALEKADLRNQVKVIVGGAPVSKEFADEIRADGYAPDAGSATLLAKKIVAGRQ
ncbi:B12-binding domain-containing protein [Chloroflexota bacterium]